MTRIGIDVAGVGQILNNGFRFDGVVPGYGRERGIAPQGGPGLVVVRQPATKDADALPDRWIVRLTLGRMSMAG